MHTIPDQVLNAFAIDTKKSAVTLLKRGHIHLTFTVQSQGSSTPAFILQRINPFVFPNVELLCNNVRLISEFLNNAKGELRAARILQSSSNTPFFKTPSGEYWRAFEFVPNSISLQRCESDQIAASAARSCALFHQALLPFPLAGFEPSLPGFQDTHHRESQFQLALSVDELKRASSCAAEVDALMQSRKNFEPFQQALKSGLVPQHMTHADLKLNNILFQQKTYKPLCLVDLDTCMPGSVVFDFGDLARSVCLTCNEDEKDLGRAAFDLKYFEILARSYLELATFLSAEERRFLPLSAALVAYQLALRFLADYLNGDKYFAAKYAEHNLVRARVQIRIMQQVVQQLDRLQAIFQN